METPRSPEDIINELVKASDRERVVFLLEHFYHDIRETLELGGVSDVFLADIDDFFANYYGDE